GEALARVLDEPAFAVHAERTRALLAAAPDGCDAAADFIDRFVPRRGRGRAAARADVAAAGA
ncbi:glycosyltransferase, partial [Burkholderia cenocepacia]